MKKVFSIILSFSFAIFLFCNPISINAEGISIDDSLALLMYGLGASFDDTSITGSLGNSSINNGVIGSSVLSNVNFNGSIGSSSLSTGYGYLDSLGTISGSIYTDSLAHNIGDVHNATIALNQNKRMKLDLYGSLGSRSMAGVGLSGSLSSRSLSGSLGSRSVYLTQPFNIPWMHGSSDKYFMLKDSDIYLVFYSKKNPWTASPSYFVNVGTSFTDKTPVKSFYLSYSDYPLSGGFIIYFHLTNISRKYLYFNDNFVNYLSNDFLPLYLGDAQSMDSSLASIIGVQQIKLDDIHYDLISGDSNSQSSLSQLNDNNKQVASNINQVNAFESDQGNKFTQSMNSLNFSSSDLISNNKYLNSAKFVRTHYENLIKDTPFQSLIIYSLTLGIALTIIGRLRNR